MSVIVRKNSTTVLKSALLSGLRAAFSFGGRVMPGLTVRRAARLMVTPLASSRARANATVADNCVTSELAVGAHRLQVYRWGNPDTQPYVLFAHGWSSYGLRFVPWVEKLREAGYAVVSFDQQAHGRSTGNRATPLDFADNLAAVGRAFGPAAAVVAHSLGGAATIRALLSGLVAERIVLIAPAADPVAATQRFARFVGLAEHLCARMIGLFEAKIAVTFDEQQAHRSIPAIARPVLVIHDLDDREVPWDEGERYARHCPEARLLSTSGLGHHRIACDDDVIAASLRFLRGERVGERVVSSPNFPYGVF
jgi:pimeloyl-ACP methyl ester carboxylesterase